MKLRSLVKKLGLLGMAAISIVSSYSCEKEENKDENSPEISVKLGEVTEKSIEAILEFKNSEKVACVLVPDAEESAVPDAKWIFENGQTAEPAETMVSMTLDAEPETGYTVYAASSKGDLFSKVSSIKVTTLPANKMLSFIDSDKTSFTYKNRSRASGHISPLLY